MAEKKAGRKHKLTDKQRRFCELVILENRSLKSAYAEVYDTNTSDESSIARQAYDLSKRPLVAKYMQELRDMVLKESMEVFTSVMLFYQEVMLDPTSKMSDRIKAGEMLSRLYGLLSDNINVGTKDDMSININISTPDE